MSDYVNCRNCNRSHAGGLSCFYGISKTIRMPVTKSNPSNKHSTARKLLKNAFRRVSGTGISFKQFVRAHAKESNRAFR